MGDVWVEPWLVQLVIVAVVLGALVAVFSPDDDDEGGA